MWRAYIEKTQKRERDNLLSVLSPWKCQSGKKKSRVSFPQIFFSLALISILAGGEGVAERSPPQISLSSLSSLSDRSQVRTLSLSLQTLFLGFRSLELSLHYSIYGFSIYAGTQGFDLLFLGFLLAGANSIHVWNL